jgi:hypothetical protein
MTSASSCAPHWGLSILPQNVTRLRVAASTIVKRLLLFQEVDEPATFFALCFTSNCARALQQEKQFLHTLNKHLPKLNLIYVQH